MIDTVAKALHNVMARGAPGPRRYWEMAPPEVKDFARALARAAIIAMEDPTDDMLKAGVDAFQHAYTSEDTLADWRAAYKANITAALGDKPPYD